MILYPDRTPTGHQLASFGCSVHLRRVHRFLWIRTRTPLSFYLAPVCAQFFLEIPFSAGLPAVSQALATTQHLLEMCRRQLPKGVVRRRLDRLANRLTKIAAKLGVLSTAAK